MLKFSFNNPPIDNIAFLMSKKPQVDFDRSEIYQSAHQRAFTIARIANIDLLADIQTSLENAFVEGQTYDEWVKELKPTLQKAGWFGKSVELINPKTKEKEFIEVGASRLKKIFYTNAKTAYQQSRAREQFSQNNSDEYLRYVAILDSRTRHTHAQMHGLILKKNNDFWKRNYPPNGWNCRCRVDSYSKEDLEEFGFKESTNARVLNIAHKDWDYDTRNLNRDDEDLLRILENKINKYRNNQPAREALELVREQLKENRAMYERIKGFWGRVKEMSSEELKSKKGKEYILIAKTDERLRSKLGTNAEAVRLSADTLARHFKHTDITAFDYALLRHLLVKAKDDDIMPSKTKDRHIIYFSKYGVNYKAVLKATENRKEIYLQSLITIKRSKTK